MQHCPSCSKLVKAVTLAKLGCPHPLTTCSRHRSFPLTCSAYVSDIHFSSESQRLYELREAFGDDSRCILCTWDVPAQSLLHRATEFLESYELCCAPLPMDSAGHELLCGATHSGKHRSYRGLDANVSQWPIESETALSC